MITTERHENILNILKKNRVVTVVELVELLKTSESTIRRDLNYLHNQGKLNKVHGGATLKDYILDNKEEVNIIKKGLNIEEKTAIAKFAATLVNDNDLIYIDAGTTTELMIDFIKDSKATFITNGIGQAKKLIQNNCKAYILGGELKVTTEAIVGSEAVSSLRKYNFTKGFFGTNGVHKDKGFTTPDISEALVKEEAVSKCHKAFILCDGSKFDVISSVTFAGIKKGTIITTKDVCENYKKYTKVLEVE